MKIKQIANVFLQCKPNGDIRDIRINEMARWIMKAVDLFAEIEYKGQEYYYDDAIFNECPCCTASDEAGHAEDCELYNLLTEAHEDYGTQENQK
jgi:hypothetical protein